MWSCFSRLDGKGFNGSICITSGDIRFCYVAARSARRCCASQMPKACICAPHILCTRHTHECEHTLTRCRSYRSQVTAGSLRQWDAERRPQMKYHNNELGCAAARSNVRPNFLMLTIHPCSTRLQVDAANPRRRCRRHQYHRSCGRCRHHRRRRRYRRRCRHAVVPPSLLQLPQVSSPQVSSPQVSSSAARSSPATSSRQPLTHAQASPDTFAAVCAYVPLPCVGTFYQRQSSLCLYGCLARICKRSKQRQPRTH